MMLPVSRFKGQPVGMVTTTAPWLFFSSDPAPHWLWMDRWSTVSYQATPPQLFYPPAVWVPDPTPLIQWERQAVEVVPLVPSFYRSSPLYPPHPLPKEVAVFQRRDKPLLTNDIRHVPRTRLLLSSSPLSVKISPDTGHKVMAPTKSLAETNGPPGVHIETNRLSGVHVETNRLSGVYLETNRLSRVHLETNRLSGVHLETNRSSGVHLETNRLSGVYKETNRLSGVYVETNRLSGVYVETNRSSGVYGETNRLSGVYVETNRSSGVYGETNRLSGVYVETNRSSGVHLETNRLSSVHKETNRLSGVYVETHRLSGVYVETHRLSGVYVETNRLSGVYKDTNRLSGVHLETNRLSGVYKETNRLSGVYVETNRLSGVHLETNRLSGVYNEINRLSGVHVETNRLSGVHVETNRLSGVHVETNRLSGVHVETNRLSGVHVEINRLSGVHVETNRLSGVHLVLQETQKRPETRSQRTPAPPPHPPPSLCTSLLCLLFTSISSVLLLQQLCIDRWPVLPFQLKEVHPSIFSSPFSSRFTLLSNYRQRHKKRGMSGGEVSYRGALLLRTRRTKNDNKRCVSVSLGREEEEDEEEEGSEGGRKDKRPVASTPVPGSPWCVVWTGDDQVFFFNPTIHLSVWERPGELIGRDISRIIADPPHKRKKTTPAGLSSCCPLPGLHGNDEDKDDEHEQNSKRNRIEEPLSLVPRPGEVKLLPLELRIAHFREMMLERGVSAFSTWEKELHKMVFDPRYLLLTSDQRKQVFDQFVKSRLKDEYKEKKNKLQKAREEFKKLLEEAKITSRSTFKEFCSHYRGDQRFDALNRKKEQEILFHHYITSLKKRDKENRARLRKMR
ncbi:uncharacterized protein tcerg1l [Anoplopoma fimbria]|uniref:uncharacterized protein tcerg1l n=1 Tax=Anoplopoma fimbria TaxID=229290 RepID=UPI0023EB2254|nr:uncharacterized protein tcerg1l [Anoplopoma fimbria]